MRTVSRAVDPILVRSYGEGKCLAETLMMDYRRQNHPLPADDPQQRRPDLTRAKELLDWSPSVQLPEGLKLTVAYFANR